MAKRDKIFDYITIELPKYNQIEKNKLNELKKDNRLYGIPPVCIDILFNRGLRSVEDILKHINSTLRDIYSPTLLKDCDIFTSIVIDHINLNSHIVVYTDYDSDGVNGGIIPVSALRNLGVKADYYTNNRFIEGYGITPKGVEMLKEKFPDVKLIITVDNGIVGFDGIKRAKELGIDVLVTDHHKTAKDENGNDILPEDALAVVNPQRQDCNYPFKGLCGAGVIFKLMLKLYWELGEDLDFIYNMLDLVAVATIGDMVPLLDENRILVREGIKKVKDENRLAFKKLREALELSDINEDTFGFKYCPLLNALGRIEGSPDDAIELFLTNDIKKMENLINKIVKVNDYRKELTKQQELLGLELANEEIKKRGGLPEALVLTHKDFHEGVVGLVAGRIKEKYNRPTVILTPCEKSILKENGEINTTIVYKGSARSIAGFNIKESLDKLSKYLIQYGGHEMAGGLSVKEDLLNDFIESLISLAKNNLNKDQLKKIIVIDAPLKASEVTVDFIQEIEALRPFGMCFAKPKFGLNDFILDPVKNNNILCGETKETVRLISCEKLTAVMFKHPERFLELGINSINPSESEVKIKAIGVPSLNSFNGNIYPQFIIDNNYLFRSN